MSAKLSLSALFRFFRVHLYFVFVFFKVMVVAIIAKFIVITAIALHFYHLYC